MHTLPNKIVVAAAAGTFLSLMGAGNASAFTIGNNRPIPVSGNSLQTVLNNINSGLTVQGPGQDQSPVDIWSVTSPNTAGSAATIVIEIAGLAGSNTFGIYDPLNPGSITQIFEGNDSAKEGATISFAPDPANPGGYKITVVEAGSGEGTTGTSVGFLDSNLFGFYLSSTSQGTFYTDDSENADGEAHALVFEGTGNTLNLPGTELNNTSFDPGTDWIIAWEDVNGGGDQDFNDMVLKIDGVGAVPEPLTMLGAGAAAGFGAFFKRQTSKKKKGN